MSPPVLSEVPHELSIPMRTPKSANGPRSNSFRPDSPFTTISHGDGRLRQIPSPHRTWSVPDASSKPQLKSPLCELPLIIQTPYLPGNKKSLQKSALKAAASS